MTNLEERLDFQLASSVNVIDGRYNIIGAANE
jgi:hypothetical protein